MKKLSYIFISIPRLSSTSALAEDDIKDMSDPLAVYTQVGTGITDKGINFKVGQAYDTGEENVAGMNVFEVKGIAGETLGWYDADPDRLTDSIDKIWLNYNPMWMTTISGSDAYKDGGIEGSDNVLTHEFAVSYQVSPKFNIRYFANCSEKTRFSDGDHRLEFNYQI